VDGERKGEFELIARIAERLRAGSEKDDRVALGIGDDAAVTVPEGASVLSVDAVVDGVHFRRETAPLRSVGWKALAATLSDLAAMGASARHALVVLGVPPDLDLDGCLELYDGLAAAASETGTTLLGGDVTRAPALFVTVTAFGELASPGDAVRRGGARAGDVLAVTGELGGAAAGLLLLERPDAGGSLASETAGALRERHLEPHPRLEAGKALARAGATAMIDLSDGLGADCVHLAAASGVRAEIDLGRVPVQDGVSDLASIAGLDVLDLVAGGGEDYELLAALPAERVDEAGPAVGRSGAALTVIGELSAGEGVELRDATGGLRQVAGFDHLASGPGSAGSARSE
jgi:thiamine-monophosphate kinase